MVSAGTDFSETAIDHFVMSITSIQTIIRHAPLADVNPSMPQASDTEEASLTSNNRNIGDFDENLGEAKMDDSVQLPPKLTTNAALVSWS